MRLDLYDNSDFDRGKPAWIEVMWLIIQALLIRSWIPGTAHRALLLRIFGATVGQGVDIKPGLRVKFPWRLEIGDHCWIGEEVWIDNLAPVSIGNHCCISQGVYLCTGNHSWKEQGFDLDTRPIVVRDHSWLCAKSVVGPGVTVEEGAVLNFGSVASKNLKGWQVHQGVPAVPVRKRIMKSQAN